MKKFIKFSIVSILIVTAAFAIFKVSSKYRVNVLKDEIDCNIITKGCEEARAITTDEEGAVYIAYSDSVKKIDSEGKENLLYKDKNLNIEDINSIGDKIFIISNDSLLSYSINNNKMETICKDIPSGGNGISRKLIGKDNEAYISIPAATNSGISTEKGKQDKSPIDIILNGVNYGEFKTGAFKQFKESSVEGEKILKSKLANAAIYKVDLKNNEVELIASGIRGIEGLDYDSNDKIKAIFTGMKNEGDRAVNRDKDYIYEINEGQWYGWPDFSGGDYITSPRFKVDEIIKPLIKNPPNKMVPSPMYQSVDLGSLKGMAIDRNGNVLNKDDILLWNETNKVVGVLNEEGIYYQMLKLNERSNIKDMLYTGNEFLLLDNNIGCIYSIHEKEGILGFKLPTIVWAFIFLLSTVLIVVVAFKHNHFSKNS